MVLYGSAQNERACFPPKGTLLNLRCSSFPCSVNRNLNASLSSGFIPICRNAFCISPSNKCGVILALTMMSHMFGCNTGPLYMQSLMLLVVGVDYALASNTILTFVVVAFSLITGLCGI